MLLKTDAVVLKNNRFGEGDMILTLFSKKIGKLQAVNKGSKRSKSRFSPGVQLFSFGEFVLYKGKDLYQVSQVDVKDSFYKLREDVEKLAHASYILELTNSVIIEGQTNNRLFNDLIKCLDILSNMNIDFETLVKAYELKLLTYSGFKPKLDSCVNCGGNSMGELRFSVKEGGLLCKQCIHEDIHAFNISSTAVNVLQYLIHTDLMNISRLKIKTYILIELNRLLKPYILTHLDKTHFKSLELLNSIKESKY